MVNLTSICVLFTFFILSTCTEELKKNIDEAKCKGVDIDISSEQMTVILECAQELGVMSKDDLTPEKKACFAKCMSEKQGLVDTAGKPHREKIDSMVDSNLPAELAKDVKMHLNKCIDDHAGKLDPKDATCMSYSPLSECVHQSFLHLCTDHS